MADAPVASALKRVRFGDGFSPSFSCQGRGGGPTVSGSELCAPTMEGAPLEEDDAEMEEASQDVGDAAASGGGLGKEDLDPFLALFDEDEGDDVSEDGVEGGLAFPGAGPEISQDNAALLYGALEADSVAAAAVESTVDVWS